MHSRYLQMVEIFTLQPNIVLLLINHAVLLFERLAVLKKGKYSHDKKSYLYTTCMYMLNCIQYLLKPHTYHPSYFIIPLNILTVFHMNNHFTLNPKETVKNE